LRIRAEGITDIGRCRQNNEDSLTLNEQQSFYVVADGVGGQPAGEVASRFVVERLSDIINRNPGSVELEAGEILDAAIREVNRSLLSESANNPAWKGMSTTIVTAWCRNNEVNIANVGDSRAYLVREQLIEQLSEDHTVLAEQQREGLVGKDSSSRMAHVLTRCLGLESDVEVSISSLPMQDGDRILLCSDGLTDSLSEEVIRSVVLSSTNPGEACRMLVELANRNGGRDNITVVLIFLDEGTIKTKISNMFGRRS